MLILVGKESPILGQFHHHIDSVILNERVPELYDMRVVNCCMQVDFSFQEEELVVTGRVADIDLDSESNTTLMA